jgi:hypothetical protein
LSAAYTGATETGAAYSILKVTSLNNQPWFTGGRYTRNLSFFHCPSNPTATAVEDAPPLLGGYNNCDLYYCRDWFDFDTYPYPETPSDARNLLQAFPPADTLVTFCIDHRASQERDYTKGHSGDIDMVLFADGTVMSLPAYNVNDPRWSTEPSLQVPSAPNPAVWPNPALWFSYQRALRGE